jgi:hypothetical protein
MVAKDEIGMAFGQIIEMALRPVQKSLAEPDTARANRDLGLGDVIARAQRVAFRIEKDESRASADSRAGHR